MRDALLVSSIATAIGGATAILIAATGELLVERTGVYNIGLEGVMLAGALAGFLGADATNSWVLGLVIAAVVGAAAAALFGLVTVALRAGSPAIDAGSDTVLGPPDNLTTDQRGDGHARKQGTHVDIGALETAPK